MRAALALLPEASARDRLAAWIDGLVTVSRGGLRPTGLPPHVSLKQPFAIEDRDALVAYARDLAARLPPMRAMLGTAGVVDVVYWLPVENDALYRRLHEQLNEELPSVVADPTAEFDGPAYRFHLTIGFLDRASASSAPALVPPVRQVTLTEMAVFLYEELASGQWQFRMHAAMRLGSATSPTTSLASSRTSSRTTRG